MSDVSDWLAGRSGDAPPPMLRKRIRRAVAALRSDADDDDDPVPVQTTLARAALDRIDAVLESPADRRAAADLLTADALLTYACEAAAEAGPETLDALVRAVATEAVAERLDGGEND